MLKKLYKHEFYSLFRTLLPIYAALLGFALLSRIMYVFDSSNNVAISAITGLSTTVYIFSIAAMFIVGIVIVVMRFYKNLLSHEGYLTFSLPFTATQHITCKLICAFVVTVINFIAMICSLLILGAGTDLLSAIFDRIQEAFNMATNVYSTATIIGFIAEVVLMIFISTLQGLLMFYAAMAIGQQFKNKIGGAVIAYICIYTAVQVVSSLLITPFVFVDPVGFEDYMNSGISAIQTFLIFPMLLSAILSTVYFFITRHFLSKKLNLE